jgi:hypothetical protein
MFAPGTAAGGPVTALPDDAALYAEIGHDVRRRMPGVYICLVVAALMSIGVFKSLPMMHGDDDYTAVDARIVDVRRDPEKGGLLMTSEFTDARGAVHRFTETDGYHYAPGDPEVGQTIEYLYRVRYGEMRAFPRADRILQWVFGAPAAFLALFGGSAAGLLLRKRSLRRGLVREGRRETGQALSIRRRTLVLPTGNNVQAIGMWRLEARYFEPSQSAFIECHSEWQHGVEPALADGATTTILVDPQRPSRYWLPVATPGGGARRAASPRRFHAAAGYDPTPGPSRSPP